MQKWVSTSIVPLCLLMLIFYIVLYFASDLISKEIIGFINVLIIIMLVMFIGIGIYAFASAASIKLADLQNSWDTLSKQSKIYYYDNQIETLYSIYFSRMMITGGCYLILAVSGIVVICFSYQYLDKLTVNWRPPLRARLSDERAQRYIEMYKKFNSDYQKVQQMQNFAGDKERERLLNNENHNKIENIIENYNSNVPLTIQENNNNLNNINNLNQYEQINKKNDEFNVEDSPNLNLIDPNENKKNKRGLLNMLKRKKKDEEDEPMNVNQ
jgi:hypothetical protein